MLGLVHLGQSVCALVVVASLREAQSSSVAHLLGAVVVGLVVGRSFVVVAVDLTHQLLVLGGHWLLVTLFIKLEAVALGLGSDRVKGWIHSGRFTVESSLDNAGVVD